MPSSMPKALRDDWVATLRSGEVKQGQFRLINDDGSMCCLGVLEYCVHGHDASKVPRVQALSSPEFLRAHGIHFAMGQTPKFTLSDGTIRSAPIINDRGMHTFDEIADLIEQQIEAIE